MRPLLLTLGFWLIPASVVAQNVQAFATDSIPAHLDSVVTRSRKDTTIQTLKQPGVIIWTTKYANRGHLRDSLAVWCTKSCRWEWDGVVEMPDSGDAPLAVSPVWGVDSIHAPAVWAMGYTGQGVKVASLDSGIDPNHPGYVVGGGYNAITNESGTNFQDDISQCNGHGTHVGGTMADRTGRGVAPGSTLYGLKVFEVVNGQCLSYTSRQISALNYAVNNNIRAVNISIGGTNNSIAYQEAITRAWNAGIVIGAANGNSGSTPALMPGRADSLLGVASVNQQLQRSGFSNYGPTTDLSAPGEGIESTLPGGGYGQKSGTSMATPHVVAAAVLVMSAEPTISGDSVMQLLRLSALPLGAQPNDYTGWGLVRPDRAIALARGGVWVAGPVQDTVRVYGEKCYPMVSTRPYTVGVTAGVQWRQVGESVCLTLTESTPRDIRITVQ